MIVAISDVNTVIANALFTMVIVSHTLEVYVVII